MLVGLYFAFEPYLQGIDRLIESPELLFQSINSALIFMGLGISFSSLQDTTKTQNEFSKKVWESPRKGKIMISLMSLMILFLLIFGLTGYYSVEKGILKDLSLGFIVLGLGMFGFLKAAFEMFENHRKDKNIGANNV
ncbi:MAG: hypothetical protein ACJA2C_000855 [Marinoscillum sp.]|jgi:hypothetical protein